MLITSQNVTEYEVGGFYADASELRLRPGEWPETFETTLGNKLPFYAISRLDDGGVRYEQLSGCIVLSVYND